MKRYAIVKVNWKCPNKDNKEEIEDIFVCANRKDKREQNHNCSDCLYGDTKEQLIHKIAQVIFIKRNSFGGKNMNPIWTETDKIYSYKLAKEIIEFLGVEK